MASPSNFQITPCVENHENFRLYRPRQKDRQTVINWEAYVRPSKDKVFARAQGLRIDAGNRNSHWHSTFSLEFEDGRSKGSTLQVMGISAKQDEGEWAIVGGTGQFARATGVITKKKHDDNWAIIDFAIHTYR